MTDPQEQLNEQEPLLGEQGGPEEKSGFLSKVKDGIGNFLSDPEDKSKHRTMPGNAVRKGIAALFGTAMKPVPKALDATDGLTGGENPWAFGTEPLSWLLYAIPMVVDEVTKFVGEMLGHLVDFLIIIGKDGIFAGSKNFFKGIKEGYQNLESPSSENLDVTISKNHDKAQIIQAKDERLTPEQIVKNARDESVIPPSRPASVSGVEVGVPEEPGSLKPSTAGSGKKPPSRTSSMIS